MVKNPFGFTSTDSSQQFLALFNAVQDKLRLVTFHKRQHKESAMLELVHAISRETRVLMTLTHKMLKTLITKHMLFLQ
jgi:hypothetical protein